LAATVGQLMAGARLVAMAVRAAVTAARRPEALAASEDLAAMVATAASWPRTLRSAALAAMPVLPERAALVATLLADLAALAVTAATVGRLMAAARLVAMAATAAVTAARRSAEMVASEDLAAMVATAAACWGTSRPAALGALPVLSERAGPAERSLRDRAALAVRAGTGGRAEAGARG